MKSEELKSRIRDEERRLIEEISGRPPQVADLKAFAPFKQLVRDQALAEAREQAEELESTAHYVRPA